jgi:hypothetical protein
MRFEREKDIPAFQGKTWRQRMVLRSQAKERDHSIIWLQCLSGALMAPVIALAYWLMSRFAPHTSFLVFFVVYTIMAYPLLTLFYGLFITPRIRKAFESDARRSA